VLTTSTATLASATCSMAFTTERKLLLP